MINIKDKKECVGCEACVQRCPKQCITFEADSEGFRYPKVHLDLCINCGLCEKVCPVLNQGMRNEALRAYAARIKGESALLNSSSGGVFYALASEVFANGGVVFGAKFDLEFYVVHGFAETIKELREFQGSKYVQSRIGDTFLQAEKMLKAGRQVLFSGTPCQIAGLRFFLRKEYDNLLLVEVACHSVPSPKVWQAYLATKIDLTFNRVNFRDKRNSWSGYGISLWDNNQEVFYRRSSQDHYMQGFLKDLYTRPSCEACPAKGGKSGSDLTIADFWGIENVLPEFDSSKGASAIIVRTQRGANAVEGLNDIELVEAPISEVIKYNAALVKNTTFPKQRSEFWTRFATEGIGCVHPIVATLQPSLLRRAFSKGFCILKSMIRK